MAESPSRSPHAYDEVGGPDGPPPRALVADDMKDVLHALGMLLEGEGFEYETARSPVEILQSLRGARFDVLLLDLNYTRDTTSGREGLDLLPDIRRIDPTLPVVVMTAWGSVEGAVEAIHKGAQDYVEKPWENDELLETVRRQVRLARSIRGRPGPGGGTLDSPDADLPPLMAESRAMEPVVEMIERVAPADVEVLIRGEPGVGKEVAARWIHRLSERTGEPLVAVDVGALSEGVFESEMFGHVRGAFTDAKADRTGYFEQADGGTLFLDEIGNLTPAQQSKLLRSLESGEVQPVGSTATRSVDVRVVSATNADLEALVSKGDFREDLMYRLNTVEIRVPPLRERQEDIRPLARHFLSELADRYDRPAVELSAGTLEALVAHPWPGNVRELRHTVHRALLLADGDVVEEDHLRLGGREGLSGNVFPHLDGLTLDQAERILVKRALRRHDGNVSRAAEALGISRSAFYRRLEQHGIER